MRRNRKFFLIVSVALIACCLACMLFACNNEEYEDCVFVADFDGLTDKPGEIAAAQATAVDAARLTLSAEKSTDTAVLESAAYLYNLANDNLQNLDFFASAAAGTGGSTVIGIRGEMSVRQRSVVDGDMWFYEGYGMITSTKSVSSGGDSSLVGVVRSALDLCERKYTPDGETFYYQDCGNEALKKDSLVNFLGKDNLTYVKENGKPHGKLYTYDSLYDYCKQNYVLKFHQENDNSDIQAKYLTDASITYDASQGLYTLKMTVDPASDALALGSASLKASANAKTFRYDYQYVTCEIWDCGLMRTYVTDNSWTAKLMGIVEGTSTNLFTRYFSYNRDSVSKLLPTDAELDQLVALCSAK